LVREDVCGFWALVAVYTDGNLVECFDDGTEVDCKGRLVEVAIGGRNTGIKGTVNVLEGLIYRRRCHLRKGVCWWWRGMRGSVLCGGELSRDRVIRWR
jgi:hypothetical protein